VANKQIRTVSDFTRFQANARIYCLVCHRSRIVEGAVITQWFGAGVAIEDAARRMKCRKCGGRGAKISPVPA